MDCSYDTGYGNERPYRPIEGGPCPDTEAIADRGDRLMFKHQHGVGPKFFIAPRYQLTAGWVIGIFIATK
jgi:hypothetical protein